MKEIIVKWMKGFIIFLAWMNTVLKFASFTGWHKFHRRILSQYQTNMIWCIDRKKRVNKWVLHWPWWFPCSFLLCLQGAVNKTISSVNFALQRQESVPAAGQSGGSSLGVGAALARCRHRHGGAHLHFFIHSQQSAVTPTTGTWHKTPACYWIHFPAFIS